ncbi:chitooligosaccharide deacetylase [Arenicella chitinivorans]|uniref:Chitooligosaccharide deacetylase n=1 Tax=Arenicella chitinivorans TaxID=1329800 RepID=A0A918RWU6_9GAMM|nr:polysaccharide deacetylase family protein [Arenicella chitinivorans]GHA14264.1 chitooligosaccharide deacetylase [Arenicella chitinivorans]
MQRFLIQLSLALLGYLSSQSALAQVKSLVWPDNKKAALALTYDDALKTHLDHVLPALDAAGLRGTFYLTIESPFFMRHIPRWKTAADVGHELGNHSLVHPCLGPSVFPERDWVSQSSDLTQYSVERVIRELRLSNEILHSVDGLEQRTFAFPCGDTKTRDGDFADAIQPLFIAARLGGTGFTDLEARRYRLPSLPAETLTGEQLIAYVQQVVSVGGFGSITFHGVGGDYLSVSNDAHQQLLDYLKDNEAVIWVDTLRAIANHLYSGTKPVRNRN